MDMPTLALPYAAVVYIFRDGKILALTRHDTDKLGVPGGKLDPGESAPEAARRELREETTLEAKSLCAVFRGLDDVGHDVEAFVAEIDPSAEPVAVEAGTKVTWVEPTVIAHGFCPMFHRQVLRVLGVVW
jgi:8-oxo-dGTP diphosphatase